VDIKLASDLRGGVHWLLAATLVSAVHMSTTDSVICVFVAILVHYYFFIYFI